MADLACMLCLVAIQSDDKEVDEQGRPYVMDYSGWPYPIVISHGDSLCLPHFNLRRGWPAMHGVEKMGLPVKPGAHPAPKT